MAKQGKPFGRYRLLEHMGKGGMGSVYRCDAADSDEYVAVKIFHSERYASPDVSRKLRDREVRMLLSVQHPNIVRFHESGEHAKDFYYAMEFVADSLFNRMHGDDNFQLADKVHIIRQTAAALTAVHHQGIVHRDVKPGNILLDEDPGGGVRVKLTDLGIAKNVREPDIASQTMRKRVPGTPKYLAPEQIRGEALDGRADVFALGIVAYELITGYPPFRAATGDEFMLANLEDKQTPLHDINEAVPTFLSDIVERMLIKDREQRYDSDTLTRDLELAHQHLLSGAALEDTTNPASLFYVATAPAVAEEPEEPGFPVAPVSWVVALSIVLAGIVVTWGFRPVAAAQPVDGGIEPVAAPGSALEQARLASQSGRRWQALELLRASASAELDDEAAALAAQETGALAGPVLRAGLQMLADERIEEARELLRQMRQRFGAVEATRQMDAAVTAELERQERLQAWDGDLAKLRQMVNGGRFEEALAECRRLHAATDDGARQAQLSDATVGALRAWADALAERGAPVPAARSLLAAAADWPVDDTAAAAPLARHYLRAADYESLHGNDAEALRHYGLAARLGDAEVATEARQRQRELNAELRTRPMPLAEFAAELDSAAFGGTFWQPEAPADEGGAAGAAEVRDGTVALSAEPGGRAALVTVRPLRNFGLDVAVRVEADLPTGGHAGMELVDVHGHTAALWVRSDALVCVLDGEELGRAPRSHGAAVVARVAYDFTTGRLAFGADDRELAATTAELGDVRLRLVVAAAPDAAATGTFGDLVCSP